MEWLNIYGLIFITAIMIPNIIFAIKCRNGFENLWKNKTAEMLEQIGRFGCFGLMIINIPLTGFGFPSEECFAIYLITDSAIVLFYCLIWIICFRKNSIFRALALSILPSILFLFSGIINRYIPLIITALIFAPCHILISYKNAVLANKKSKISSQNQKST